MSVDRPRIYAVIQCGHCYAALDHDGDWLYCSSCYITWGTDNPYDEDAEPRFYNEDDEPCRNEDAPAGRSGEVDGRAFTVSYSPCWLPLGHTSKHDYSEDYTFAAVAA
jgi:hypothetical protein